MVTATQFGYTSGIILLVPLGDRVPYRRLIVTLLVLTGLGLLAAGAPGLVALLVAGAQVGVTTVVAQIIGPMVAGLVDADRRGLVSGTLLAGSLGGMLLSRALGGALAEWLGWRAPYLDDQFQGVPAEGVGVGGQASGSTSGCVNRTGLPSDRA